MTQQQTSEYAVRLQHRCHCHQDVNLRIRCLSDVHRVRDCQCAIATTKEPLQTPEKRGGK